MRILVGLLVPLLLVLPLSVSAADSALVEGVQMPAWVERGAVRSPLAPGEALRSGDRVVTGASGRILLRAPDGSTIEVIGDRLR